MMKKKISIFILAVFFLCTGPLSAGTVTLATGEWPPFIGEVLTDYGLHSKIIKTVFTEMGHEVHFEFMPWKRVYELTKKGDFVGTFTWSKTKDRADEMLYPENELSLSKEVGFYKASKFPSGLVINSLDDIKAQNLKVVGIASYWYEKPLKEKGINVHIVSTAGLGWKMLNAGRVDLMIENSDVGQAESQSTLGAGKHKAFKMTAPLKTQQMYLIFSRVHPQAKAMVKAYDNAVSRLKAAGKL